MNPYRNKVEDVHDAIECWRSMYDLYDSEYDWVEQKARVEKRLEPAKVEDLDRITHAPDREWDRGELSDYFDSSGRHVDREQFFEAITPFRGKEWAQNALQWLDDGFPAVVVVHDGPDDEQGTLCDGFGRFSLAYALGLEELPVIDVWLPEQTLKMPTTEIAAILDEAARLVEAAQGDKAFDEEEFYKRDDEYRNGLDYRMVQEGDDVARVCGDDGRGYTYTSIRDADKIAKNGWGVHPSLNNFTGEHESAYWAVMFLKPEDALTVYRNEKHDMSSFVDKKLREIPDLRVAWFYPTKTGGSTAKSSEVCLSFSAQQVGDWVGTNADIAFIFCDNATYGMEGFAIAWQGPPIPAKMMTLESSLYDGYSSTSEETTSETTTIAASKPAPIKNIKVYHGTNTKFDEFDPNMSAMGGIIWFTDSLESIKTGSHGAGNKYVMTRLITINNPAGWDEYEKYGIGELRGMGYDGVILEDDGKTNYIVFDVSGIKKVRSDKPSIASLLDEVARRVEAADDIMSRLDVVALMVGPSTLYIEWFALPRDMRGRGLGKKAWEMWEASLPKHIKLLRLHAADSGSGPTDDFWMSVGFEPRYLVEDDSNYEAAHEYQKGINGGVTPKPVELEPE